MDSIKICDSQLSERNPKSLHGFLDQKLKSRSADSISSVYTTDLETSDEKPDRLTPNYSFEFQSFSIG
jgi:predicted transposase YdaD